ncbi:MAG TPA: SusC/RagA family TonB-linked outer membrane protein [Flavobacterium sp.]
MKLKFKGFLVLFIVLMTQITFAQERMVSGVVSDNSGLPLPGVTVLIKGAKTGIQTDFDGKYSIKATPNQILVFSYIGMNTQEVTASSTTINIKLASATVELEGVVVTALGIKRQQKSLGYATTTVNKEQITNVTTNNPIESLSGKIAGVDISAPTQPGSSTKVIVRGIGSISGTNQPLYVVDGTPINNDGSAGQTRQDGSDIDRSYDAGTGINDIDPNSIESITFLKGAAATALYGSRAGRGAIIITTKKGKNQSKINIDFSTSVEMSEVARVPHLQNSYGQGWNGLGYSRLPSGLGPSFENGSWGPAFNGEVRPWGSVYNNSQQIKPYVALEDNIKDFYDVGLLTSTNINLSAGNEFSDFSLGYTKLKSDGVIPTSADKYLKNVLTFNGGVKNEKGSIRLSLNYTNKDQNAVNTGQSDNSGEGDTFIPELMQIPRDVSVIDLKDYKNNPFNTPSYYFTPFASNPYWALNENKTQILGQSIFGNTNFNYNITDNLTATWQIGGNYKLENIKSYGAIINFEPGSPQNLNNTLETVGGVSESRLERSEFDTYFNLNYNKNINDDFKINIIGGVSYNKRETDFLNTSITNLIISNFYELTNTAARPEIEQNNTLRKTFGIYGQAELSYIDKYFLTLTGRNDKSSTLPPDNNSYFYPSVSLSGIVIDNQETFLKLRGSWSQVANDTNPYQTANSFINGSADSGFGDIISPLGGVGFFEASGILGNPDLKPERTTEIEFGTEASFFKRRITIDAAVYHRTTEDLIVSVPLDPSTGFLTKALNIGDVENKGIEIALGIKPINGKDFSWEINYTFTKNLNEVTKVLDDRRIDFGPVSNGITFSAKESQPIGSFYGLVPKKNKDGQFIVDENSGLYIPSDDVELLGNGQRKFIMGLQNTFKYKNISLSFSFDWKEGGKMYSRTKDLSHFVGNGIETTYNDRNTYIIPNSVIDNGDGTFSENTTAITLENFYTVYNDSDNPASQGTFLIDKTFVRMRDISLYYNFNNKIVEQLGLTKFTIGAYGRNLFLWTPDTNPYVDPEVTSFGNDLLSEYGEFGANPSQRAYGCVIKLSF